MLRKARLNKITDSSLTDDITMDSLIDAQNTVIADLNAELSLALNRGFNPKDSDIEVSHDHLSFSLNTDKNSFQWIIKVV